MGEGDEHGDYIGVSELGGPQLMCAPGILNGDSCSCRKWNRMFAFFSSEVVALNACMVWAEGVKQPGREWRDGFCWPSKQTSTPRTGHMYVRPFTVLLLR